MNEKDNFEINFDDKYEEIIAAMQQKEEQEYEDIVSDSSLNTGKHAYEDISSNSTAKHNKKANGFKTWWQHLSRGKKTILISATSVVLVIAILLGWFFTYFKYNYNPITTNPEELGFAGVKDKSIINVALFGVDSRDETVFKGNTDSIMILSLNTNTKKVKIFSIMRDTLVPMEYEGKKYYGKINSAYSKGPEHAIKTLNQAFDLDISEYATVNFYGMTDIIDAVGGITATITQDELAWKGNDHPNLNNCMDEICSEMGLNPKKYYIHTSGEQTLNGVQAVAYARVRHCTSVWGTRDDFGRTDRQRHVMQELFNKAVKMKKTQYVSLIKALIPCSETSLSYSDILGLAVNILLSSPTFEQYRLPPAEYQTKFLMTSPSGYGSVIYYDLEYAAKMINAIIYDDATIEQFVEHNPIEKNNWYYEMTGTNGKPSSNTQPSQPSTTPNEPEVPPEEPAKNPEDTGDLGDEKDDVEDLEKPEENEEQDKKPEENEEPDKDPEDTGDLDNEKDDVEGSEKPEEPEQSSPTETPEETLHRTRRG